MEYIYSFNTYEELVDIIEINKDKRIVSISYLKSGNIVTFSNEPNLENKISILQGQNANLLLDNAKKEIEINRLNKNLANVTLEIAKIKGGM